MKKLIDKLNEASNLYYNYGTSPLTDKEYDILLQQLKEEEAKTGIIYSNSPTQKVGAPVLNERRKVKILDRPMLSLKKVYTQEEIDKFANGQELVAMVKCDGLSVRIIYEDGKIISANTRGDGLIGQDISEHIKYFKNVPLTISYKQRFVIDGEAVILDQDFKELTGFANNRNTAAGTLNLLDMKEVKNRKLSFIAWDIISSNQKFNNFTEILSFADSLGFQVCPYSLTAINEDIRNKAIEQGIPQDGVVWRYNNISYGESLGRTAHHWNYACAYKFSNELYETNLQNIEWTIGRSGVLTPVAVFDEVDDESSIITRASLHNISIMDQILGSPYKREKLWIFKANEIIPQVHHAIRSLEEKEYFTIPDKCPYCGAPTEVRTSDSGTVELYCSAQDSCSGILINKLDHFCGKKGLDIKGLSKMTLEKLINWGLVNNITNIFTANYDSLIFKPGFGEKSVTNLILSIKKARHTTLSKFISALGIPLIGKVNAEAIANYCADWDDFMELVNNEHDFTNIEGFGNAMTDSILHFDYNEADKLVKNGIITFEEGAKQETTNNLEGLIFVVTGALKTHWKNRDELKAEIARTGGKVTESVTSKTSYLVNNDINSTSSKNKKAKELNIPIITEEEMYQMMNGDK